MEGSRKWIVNGDRTDHGGTVIASAAFVTAYDKPVARVGDTVLCPRCKQPTIIVEGDATMIVLGQPQAYEGCLTSCGARLVSTQQHTTWFTDAPGSAPPAAPAATLAAIPGDEPPETGSICLECLLGAAKRGKAVLER